MDQAFLESMKQKLMEQKKTILDSLAGQDEDMKGLVKTVESGASLSLSRLQVS